MRRMSGGVRIDLQHCRQRSSWDCGLAAVAMVLPAAARRRLLAEPAAAPHRPTWTIDLCHQLGRFGVPHTFCTTSLGARPAHRHVAFYRHFFERDAPRVNESFKQSAARGLVVREASLALPRLLEHLHTGPVILLVDAGRLSCTACQRVAAKTDYQGHYVVLCGYDASLGQVLYRNPSLSNRVCCCAYDDLDEARRSFGTDEDAILIGRLPVY